MSQSQSWRAWLLYFITILYISHSQEESIEVLSIARLQSDPFPIQLFTRRGIHNDTIHIEIHGPADRWFGIGIGNETMDGTYAFIVSDDGNLTERRLGDHNAGLSLPTHATELEYSQTAINGRRIVTITRSREGYSNLFYEFPAGRLDNVGLIAAWAISPGDPFGNYHGDSNYLTGTTNFVLSNETTDDPTLAPTLAPSFAPTLAPTGAPSLAPTHAPSLAPTYAPTDDFWTRYDLWGTKTFATDKGNGEEDIVLYLGIEASTNTVFINVTGSTQQWFAIGFGFGSSMKDKYAIIVDWTTGGSDVLQLIEQDNILEYFLGDHNIGQKLEPFVERKTQFATSQFRRNVLMERPTFYEGDESGNYFNFSVCNREYDMVWARGTYSGRRNNPQNFELGTGHTGFDRGSGVLSVREVIDGEFGNCSWTISISQTINWKLIISLIFIVIFNMFH